MKILQISTGYDISFNGGITNYVRNISNELIEGGHDVTVLYSQDNGQKKDYKFEIINIETILRPFHLSSVITNNDCQKIDEIVRNLNPDIIHVHMMIDLPIDVLAIFKKYSKVVVSLHDYSYVCNRIILLDRNGKNCLNSDENRRCNTCISLEESIDNRIFGGSLRRFAKGINVDKLANSSNHYEKFKVVQKLFSEMDSIIAVSNRVKDIYISNGFVNNQFYVNHIGNYTAEKEFRDSFGTRKNINYGERIKFGFIGNLNYHKGSEVFLKLAKDSKHEFHIYGGIDAAVNEEIRTMKNVFYHGKYTHDQLKDILKNVDFGLVLPIWEDNAPQVIFEFLNSGIPIIGTRMGGLPDFINESNGVLFENMEEEIIKIKSFIESNEVFNFYNSVINSIKGTKTAGEHMNDLLEIYEKI